VSAVGVGLAVVWRCGSCAALVRDLGPAMGAHPDDYEAGHRPGCARQRAALTAWRRDDDGHDDGHDEPDVQGGDELDGEWVR